MRASTADLRGGLQSVLDAAVDAGVTPGASCVVVRAGRATQTVAGFLATTDADGSTIPVSLRVPVTADTVYDLASVTKVYSAVTLLRLVDEGVLSLDEGIGRWLPEYRHGVKQQVTLTHLLTHTSGIRAEWDGWRKQISSQGTDHAEWLPGDRASALNAITGLELERPPGQDFEYSCLGYITAMAAAEAATGERWDRLVAQLVLEPLGLDATTFRPDRKRTAPTEYQPQLGRGLVHGVVHDETACALDGLSANAGLFATASDLARFGQALLAGLPSILSPLTSERMWADALPGIFGERARAKEEEIGFGHGLGLRIGAASWMGPLADARGHNGFTGTSLLVDRELDLVVALLTNRVHPSREGSNMNGLRAQVHSAIATAFSGAE